MFIRNRHFSVLVLLIQIYIKLFPDDHIRNIETII